MASKLKTIDGTDTTQPAEAVEERELLQSSAVEQKIRERAYEIYLKRGAHPGCELDDWLRAKHELGTYPSNES